ncbi:MAG: methionine biosynthesis protein MetW [Candidatus Omnitrophica bacterium]|jgi:methionine biosynthesis protein MetW|nr:methionine biosynthesis protein MetW [Candidatus Omnitrophota bacterium]
MNIKFDEITFPHKIIVKIVEPTSTVLDLGCGNGELLEYLITNKHVQGYGIEIEEQSIYKCIERGISVFHLNLDSGLSDYNDKSFDYVILDQTLQEVKNPDKVLHDALRVGSHVIVSFPNFAHYKARWQLAIMGKAPIAPALPFEWYNTPNLHFLSLYDFVNYCKTKKITIEQNFFISKNKLIKISPNFRAQIGIFVIKK